MLWCIYRHPEARLREIAVDVGITERMVHKIVTELAAAKYVRIEKDGRNNVYHLQVERPLRHPLESHCQVGQMLEPVPQDGALTPPADSPFRAALPLQSSPHSSEIATTAGCLSLRSTEIA